MWQNILSRLAKSAWNSASDASFHIQQLWMILSILLYVVIVLLEYLTDCSIRVSRSCGEAMADPVVRFASANQYFTKNSRPYFFVHIIGLASTSWLGGYAMVKILSM